MDQEAESQVVPREPLKVEAEGTAGAKPPTDPGDDLRADLVVTDEGDVARSLRAGLRLAQVMEERTEAQRVAAG